MNKHESLALLSFEAEMGAATFAGNMAVFTGKVFEAGSYPNQRIDMSSEDNKLACSTFSRCPIKDTHDDEQSVFRGRLGHWTQAKTADGKDVDARLELPAPIVALFGAGWKPKVSVEIDRRTKQFSAIALLNYPQVEDAEVRAAFAQFAGARHSKDDMDHVQQLHDHACALGAQCDAAMGARHSGTDQAAFQHMHDMAVEQGASCPAPEAPAAMRRHDQASASAASASKEKSMKQNQSLWDRVKARFSKDPEVLKAVATLEAQDFDIASFTGTPEAVAVDPELAQRIAVFEGEQTMFRAKMLRDEAAKFANTVIYSDRKARKAQFDSIVEMYVMAAEKDGGGTAKFGANFAVVEGAAVAFLKKHFEAQPADKALMGDQIADGVPSANADREARAKARLARSTEAYN